MQGMEHQAMYQLFVYYTATLSENRLCFVCVCFCFPRGRSSLIGHKMVRFQLKGYRCFTCCITPLLKAVQYVFIQLGLEDKLYSLFFINKAPLFLQLVFLCVEIQLSHCIMTIDLDRQLRNFISEGTQNPWSFQVDLTSICHLIYFIIIIQFNLSNKVKHDVVIRGLIVIIVQDVDQLK